MFFRIRFNASFLLGFWKMYIYRFGNLLSFGQEWRVRFEENFEIMSFWVNLKQFVNFKSLQ